MGLFSKRQTQPVIDLREKAPVTKPVPYALGYPTTCPSCGSRGYLDHIDPFKRVQYEHCPSCFTKWDMAEDELLAKNR